MSSGCSWILFAEYRVKAVISWLAESVLRGEVFNAIRCAVGVSFAGRDATHPLPDGNDPP